MAEYAILDDLKNKSDERLELYCQENNLVIYSGLEELTEGFAGNSPAIRVWMYKNYISRSGPVDLLIIICEMSNGTLGEFALNNVQTSIFQLYNLRTDDSIDLPPSEKLPVLHPDVIKFILEKRNLPKKKNDSSVPFNPNTDKWSVNRIAEELKMSNRVIGRFCRIKNI